MAKSPSSAPPERQNPLDSLQSLGTEAVKAGTPAFIVWAAVAIVAITFTLTPSFFSTQRPDLGAGTIAAAFIAILLLVWIAIKNPANILLQYRWRVVQQPIRNEAVVEELIKELKLVLEAARTSFGAVVPGIEQQVRANIFLADYRRAPEGVAFELRIPAAFRPGMLKPTEWDIAFQPGQGATGEVFIAGQPVLTTDRLYGVPESRKAVFKTIIPDDLKAIISLPIFDDERSNVIAVLNVDVCGDAAVGDELLPKVYEVVRASQNFKNVCNSLNRLDKAWLTIGLSRG